MDFIYKILVDSAEKNLLRKIYRHIGFVACTVTKNITNCYWFRKFNRISQNISDFRQWNPQTLWAETLNVTWFRIFKLILLVYGFHKLFRIPQILLRIPQILLRIRQILVRIQQNCLFLGAILSKTVF